MFTNIFQNEFQLFGKQVTKNGKRRYQIKYRSTQAELAFYKNKLSIAYISWKIQLESLKSFA